MIEVGDKAPDFTLQGVDEWRIESFTLSEHLRPGRFVVLSFYVWDFSPVCTSQMCDLNQLSVFEMYDDVTLWGVSPDSPYSHKKFVDENDIDYPLLSDTAQRVAEAYGVLYEEKDGLERVPQRSLFLVDGRQRVRSKWVAEDNWHDWETEPFRDMKHTLDEIRASD